ncbi:MAG: multi-sensor hybrid histidine kinase [Crocinitomicaceae bacterium]|jgi:signal transduction histidine kinase/DNA-binding response OmpR family regulator|nr:multi-sensor hybrid histidine kinase [Crocinitomicaceae bacterium]
MKFFKYEISSIILLTGIFFLVILTGVYVNRKISTTIEKVNVQAAPDNRLLLMKSLTGTLTEAENNLYSFNLTKDKTYLDDFYKTIRNSEKKLTRLKNMSADDPVFKSQVDTFEFFVFEKFKILDSLMLTQNQYRVTDALNVVQEKIDEVSALERAQNEPKAKGLSIFKRKKNEANLKITYFKKELEEIRKMESYKEITNNSIELGLIQYDRFIMKKIAQMLDRLEKRERMAIARKSEAAGQAAKDAKKITIIFSVFCSLLLLLIFYTIIRYIRKNNEYKKILKKAKQESDELAEAKVRFLSNMSHELRTPLNSIIGFTDLLTNPESKLTNEQRREKLGIIQKSAQLLLKLLNNILDHTKLQANKIEFEKEDFDIILAVREVFQILEESARVKNNQLILHVSTESLHVKGDSFKLKQILLNLVGNAIKFTENGTIEINLKFESNEAGRYLVHMSVNDTGIGIASDRLEHIFNEFEQESMHTSKEYGGTGLGLNITKTLIELQGGSIRVNSKKGQGTTFFFSIPYEHGKVAQAPVETPVPAAIDITQLVKGRKIMVVDDEPFNRKLLSSLLNPYDVELYEASNGEEAFELARNIQFDLILMDIRMPKMNGIDATKQIKALQPIPVPIVALSAGSLEDDKNTAFIFDAVLPKPFKNDHLLAVISKLLDKNTSTLDLNLVLAEDDDDENDKHYDLANLRVMAQGSQEFFDEMLELFIRTSKEGISQMQGYLDEKDFYAMSQIAHRIAAPCKHLEANKMYALIKLIENYKKNAFTYEEMKFVLEKLKSHSKQLIANLEAEKFEEKSI